MHPCADSLSSAQRENQTFPWILYNMLERSDNIHLPDIISFQPHGRSIKIHNRNRFQLEILPRYFPKQSTIASFQRQLSLYGFLRMVKDGPDQNSYYHEMFLQGRPDIIYLMKRIVKKGNMVRHLYDPSTEPNFYTMPSIQSLVPPRSNVNNDVANQIPEPNPTDDCCKETGDSKPAYQIRPSIQLYDFDASTLITHPIISSTSHNDIHHRNANVTELFNNFPAGNVSIPYSGQFNTSLMTIAQPYSDTGTRNTMVANTPAASSGTAWNPLSTYSPSVLPVTYNPTILPVETSQHINPLSTTNNNPMVSVHSPPSFSQLPQFQAAMQLYSETLDEYYKLRNQLILNQQLMTHQQNATNNTNESADHRADLLKNQEERPIKEQNATEPTYHHLPNTGYRDHFVHATGNNATEPTSHHLPSTGYRDHSVHETGNDATDGNENTNSRSSIAYNNGQSCRFFDTSYGGNSAAWGNQNDDIGDDGTISDESLNRDWGIQKNG